MLADYLLPVTGGFLRPCTVPNRLLTPIVGGHHCQSCQRPVHDFTHATAADVAQAQRAAPDGRLCGRFVVQQPAWPGFSRRLRCFVVALVLIVGRGLTAQEALAQVQAASSPRAERPRIMQDVPGTWVEQMPELKGGGGTPAIVRAVQRQFDYSPIGQQKWDGKVYLSFWVSAEGNVEDVKVVKGYSALVDSAAVRAVQSLHDWIPGRQNGHPVGLQLTIPIFYRKPD